MSENYTLTPRVSGDGDHLSDIELRAGNEKYSLGESIPEAIADDICNQRAALAAANAEVERLKKENAELEAENSNIRDYCSTHAARANAAADRTAGLEAVVGRLRHMLDKQHKWHLAQDWVAPCCEPGTLAESYADSSLYDGTVDALESAARAAAEQGGGE